MLYTTVQALSVSADPCRLTSGYEPLGSSCTHLTGISRCTIVGYGNESQLRSPAARIRLHVVEAMHGSARHVTFTQVSPTHHVRLLCNRQLSRVPYFVLRTLQMSDPLPQLDR